MGEARAVEHEGPEGPRDELLEARDALFEPGETDGCERQHAEPDDQEPTEGAHRRTRLRASPNETRSTAQSRQTSPSARASAVKPSYRAR